MKTGDNVRITFDAVVVTHEGDMICVDLPGHEIPDHFFYFNTSKDNVKIERTDD